MPVGTIVRIYELAKELKLDTKRVIEDVRREGADVSVPSNSVSREIAEKVRNKYFPKLDKVEVNRIGDTSNEEVSALDLEQKKSFPLSEMTEIEEPVAIHKEEAKDETSIVNETPVLEEGKFNLNTKEVENKNILAELKEDIQKQPIITAKEAVSIKPLKLPCSSCKKETTHKLVSSTDIYNYNEKYFIYQCRGCETISFRKISLDKNNYTNNIERTELLEFVQLYPIENNGRQKLEQNEQIPPEIAKIYDEIHQAISNKLFVLTAIGIRSLIETLCKDRKAKGNKLPEMIRSLVDMKLLTEKNAKILEELKNIGNIAAHQVKSPSEKRLHTAMDIIEHLIKDVYTLGISDEN